VFALALVATLLIIAGFWVTIPDEAPAWEAWLNRALAIGTVWMTAVLRLQAASIGNEESRRALELAGSRAW
jgi:hypothetical protein